VLSLEELPLRRCVARDAPRREVAVLHRPRESCRGQPGFHLDVAARGALAAVTAFAFALAYDFAIASFLPARSHALYSAAVVEKVAGACEKPRVRFEFSAGA
jgi:hypothetical protein